MYMSHYNDAIHSYLESLTFSPAMCAVFGSVARGNARESSDIDVILVRHGKDLKRTYKSQIVHNGQKFQGIIGTESAFARRMDRSTISRDNFISYIISESIFIFGDHEIFTTLQDHARRIEAGGAPRALEDELASYAMRIHDALDKLGSTNGNKRIHVAFHLMRILGFFILRLNDQWLIPGSYSFEAIRSCEPKFFDDLYLQLRVGIESEDFSSFKYRVREYIVLAGFPAWESKWEVSV